MKEENGISNVVSANQAAILEEWMRGQMSALSPRGSIKEGELRQQSAEFLEHFTAALRSGATFDSPGFAPVRDMLTGLARSRAQQGFTPAETATFILSLRQALFQSLRTSHSESLGSESFWSMSAMLDRLALFAMEGFMNGREEVITRQQQELMELSTPVVELWDGILALPLIGTLDSSRTQVVMESLLQKIVETGAPMAIIDITGVPYVDTLVAQHLLKTIAAARLMGADCIISGIRPQIAQTIVHLGVDLQDVTTKATLADAFSLALARAGARVVRDAAPERS